MSLVYIDETHYIGTMRVLWLQKYDDRLRPARAASIIFAWFRSQQERVDDFYSFGDPDVPARELRQTFLKQWRREVLEPIRRLGYPNVRTAILHISMRTDSKWVYKHGLHAADVSEED